ncbi:MAG TPA: bifunctional diaminohydroxyphosphoribosylaminopyrimidine deaminase/5-amino-6-(5-phosphoribosylamino)uracil reductase RibD [Streptosporangiaceae bacterium]|jgi:diaminohydroxyphosphoribosylaminopyrimidine deaminase/5-amino-6-(5-phosphoribosylamino)uracil reductase|nr:bifunctional diaminohydroxyphosphoribosylaminopyrimidine deaminase/5-amino-6-(5-phosphoribosylamino)uracil reductase RibD [Streptosporangiaceae bacterium]
MATPLELAVMRRAIALSAAGLGTTSPNPPVGCVVLDPQGRIVGEGYHERKGEAHAETQALAAAGTDAGGATAVVTLEPCNHHGRTPPCRQALIDAHVKRVVIALIDPTSRGEGGAAALRAAGIDVETGVLANEARVVLGPWLSALQTQRPLITWPYLITADGIEALPEGTAEAGLLRRNADAVLRADGTVTEAVPGTHGAGILKLADMAPGARVLTVAGSLYEAGVRHLLLADGVDAADRFLDAGLVDRVLAYTPDGSGSCRPAAVLPWPEVPPGFTITGAARIDGYVRIEAWRDTSR